MPLKCGEILYGKARISGTSGKWAGLSQEFSLCNRQADPPIAHRIAAAPVLGEGDADAAGNGF
jgi:hypothetical protein